MNEPHINQISSDAHATAGRIRVAVLFGGQSTEHGISCISAGAIMAHLDPARYQVIPIGITRDGAWVPYSHHLDSLSAPHAADETSLPSVSDTGTHVQLVIGGTPGELRYSAGDHIGRHFATADVIFPVLHGINGEDGTIQGLLDLVGVPYVGNGVLASAAGMDKAFTKKIAREAGIPITPEVVLNYPRELSAEERAILGLPVFVKPARGGSSIGISKVTSWEELPAAIQAAAAHDTKIVVEAMVHGAEVECGVLQYPSGEAVTSVPAMLQGTEDGDEGFYGFDAKYVDNTVTAAIPAPLDPEMEQDVRRQALATFHALGCEGLARVDFFITNHGPVLNEINTMPGFTPISMYPKMFAASGVDYEQLLRVLIDRAVQVKKA